MQDLWIKYSQIFDALSNRSKVLTLLIIMLLIFMLWLFMFWQPTAQKNQELKNQIQSTSQEISALQKQIAISQVTLDKLKQQVKSLASNLRNQLPGGNNYIPPQKMVDTLKRLAIETRSSLNLTSLDASPSKTTPLINGIQQLLEHNVTIKLTGSYFAAMGYIRSIEKLNWPIYWDYLSYKVTQYPSAEITLKVHTTSIMEE